jgi:hypothetical protein
LKELTKVWPKTRVFEGGGILGLSFFSTSSKAGCWKDECHRGDSGRCTDLDVWKGGDLSGHRIERDGCAIRPGTTASEAEGRRGGYASSSA